MCSTGEIIIISYDDNDEEDNRKHDTSCSVPSVHIVEVEDVQNSDCASTSSALDKDLIVTFFRRADMLPHARFDCPIHPFIATNCEIRAPVACNQLICDQCFCYICDKLASSCAMWCYSGLCHCNSHNKGYFWKNLRHSPLLGSQETSLKFALSEMDAQIQDAEVILQVFRNELAAQFFSFLMAVNPPQRDLSVGPVYSQSSTQLVTTSCGSALPAPSAQFLHEAKRVVNSILLNKSNMQIPQFFIEVYPDQALLLLVTGALGLRILDSALSPALPVLRTFEENVLALQWLKDRLSSSAEWLSCLLQEVAKEMKNTTDGENLLSFLRTPVPTQSSSTEHWNHWT